MTFIVDGIDIDKELAPSKKYKSWVVYLDNAVYDTVYYTDDKDSTLVRRALIVEGYPREIKVVAE